MASVATVSVAYDGDLERTVADLSEELAALEEGVKAVVSLEITGVQPQKGSSGHLQAFRRLVRLCPYPVVARLQVEKLCCTDVLVLLSCDLVQCTSNEILVEASNEAAVVQLAINHWELFTGKRVAVPGRWDCSYFDLCLDGPLQKHIGDYLPHFWMSLRNAGTACKEAQSSGFLGNPVAEVEHKPASLSEVFTYYFGPKIAAIFSAGEVLPADDGGRPKAADVKSACRARRKDAQTVEVTLTSDIMFVGAEVVQEALRAVSAPEVKIVDVTLEDGAFCGKDSIFPAGSSDHMRVYKWHRKWEQLLASLKKDKHLRVTAAGSDLCPPLLELFFAAHARAWSSAAEELAWCRAPFAYAPGPGAMMGFFYGMPLACLRKVLVAGLRAADLQALGVACESRTPAGLLGLPSSWFGAATKEPEPDPRSSDVDKAGARVEEAQSSVRGGGRLKLPDPATRPATRCGSCSCIGYGLAVPDEYKATQEEIGGMLGVERANKAHWSVLTADHIKTRCLAELAKDLEHPESVGIERLHEKQLEWGVRMLVEAIGKALCDAGIDAKAVGHISIVTSTGYQLPGLTAWVLKEGSLGLRKSVSRADIVGMGCHAGLNSLKSAAAWAVANPGGIALACGVEVCSAQYVWGIDTRTKLNNVIVNSLFGDGCFCAVMRTAVGTERPPPAYFDMPPSEWSALCDTDAIEDMIYRPEVSEGKTRFDLSELAPYHVGQGLFSLMHESLRKRIPVHYANHVITHTGGKTVLECSRVALGLEGPPKVCLPHTIRALREYGNQSSCSILFAFHNLVTRGWVREGDAGLFITMGPGAGLELAMWTAGSRFPKPMKLQSMASVVSTAASTPSVLGSSLDGSLDGSVDGSVDGFSDACSEGGEGGENGVKESSDMMLAMLG